MAVTHPKPASSLAGIVAKHWPGSRAALARNVGVSPPVISNWCNRKYRVPEDRYEPLAKALGVPVSVVSKACQRDEERMKAGVHG